MNARRRENKIRALSYFGIKVGATCPSCGKIVSARSSIQLIFAREEIMLFDLQDTPKTLAFVYSNMIKDYIQTEQNVMDAYSHVRLGETILNKLKCSPIEEGGTS